MRRYIVWNPEKIGMWMSNYVNVYPLDTYKGLIEVEKHDNCSWSSEVKTDDIKGLLQAVYNETDVDLCFIEIRRTYE